jgi:hypothetical protein
MAAAVDRLMRKAAIAERYDRRHETLARIEGYQHLIGGHRDRVAAGNATFDFDEMQMSGLRITTFDIITNLVSRHIARLPAQGAFDGQDGLHRYRAGPISTGGPSFKDDCGYRQDFLIST